jgi:hypothetical protein
LFDKAAIVEALTREKARKRFTVRSFGLKPLGSDFAHVTYRVLAGSPDGSSRTSLRSSLWARREGEWKLVFHQGTPLDQESRVASGDAGTESATSAFSSVRLPSDPTVTAPDGSDVRMLLGLQRGGMAHFELGAGHVSSAVVHKTVEEIWFIVGGMGQMWRRHAEREETMLFHVSEIPYLVRPARAVGREERAAR